MRHNWRLNAHSASVEEKGIIILLSLGVEDFVFDRQALDLSRSGRPCTGPIQGEIDPDEKVNSVGESEIKKETEQPGHHSTSMEAHVSPPPKLMSMTRSPFLIRPSSTASQRLMRTEAEEQFPSRSTLT